MPTASKKVINGWAMYDWANSVYNLVITTTFFPIYFTSITKEKFGEDTVPFLGRTFKNSALYIYAFAFAYLLIAILLPILSSIADSRGNKKKFMQFFCYLGGLSCMGLFWFEGNNVGWGLLCFVFAAIGYIGSLVFYNSYLPEIAALEDQDRVSAKGFSYGYVGSVIMQLIGFGLVLYFKGQGNEKMGLLVTFLLVGLWWIGFAQITFARLPPSLPVSQQDKNFLTQGFIELKEVFIKLSDIPVLKRFLFAFFFYSMGVQTVMGAATIFGERMLKLPATNLIVTLIIIQLVAVAGAILMSRLSAKFGNLKVLMLVIIFWIVICIAAYFVADAAENGINAEYYFYGLAIAVGLVMGGIQSLSRSTYSKLMPVTRDTASFFSFYDVAEKVAIVIGMITYAYIDEIIGMKYSVLALILFFIIGLAGLMLALQKQKRRLTIA
ncbi:MAG TPA: MFS transporter [Flavitalea sp.]|nr:MFS transporter [Flavitalea sp.]